MSVSETDAPPQVAAPEPLDAPVAAARPTRAQRRRSRRRRLVGLRPRLLVWFLGLAGMAMAVTLFTSHQLLDAQLTERVDLSLRREASRFELAASQLQPDAVDAEADLVAWLRSYLASAPIDDEQALLVTVQGRPVGVSADPQTRLDELDQAVAIWGAATSGHFGSIETPAGEYRYLVMPIQVGELNAALVTGEFTDAARQSVDEASWRLAGMSVLILAAAAVLAWCTASRALRPVHRLAESARQVSGPDVAARLGGVGRGGLGARAETF
jgi:hypothetical protein